MKKDKYKRLELYLGWKCNQKCFFCVEMPIMQKNWNKLISNEEILAKLIYFKKQNYNHITFLGGEPTIQPNFLFAIKTAKKLGYKVLISTNGAIYQFDDFSKQTLSYIDEIIISVTSTNEKIQKQITGNKNFLDYNKVFSNLKKYFYGTFIKINVVLHKKSINDLENIFKLMKEFSIKEISLTYPEFQADFYGKGIFFDNILKFSEIKIDKIFALSKKYDTIITTADFPLCILGKKFLHLSEDIKYSKRLKIDQNVSFHDRISTLPRSRINTNKCKSCKYINVCWGAHKSYLDIFSDDELKKF